MAEKKIINDLEAQIGQLIDDHRRLTLLSEETAAERDGLRRENRRLQERVRELEKELDCMQLSRSLQGDAPDRSKAIARVNRLMREVDRCIALLYRPDRTDDDPGEE
ncbi:MAG: hypothetical protein K2O63_04240 [Alistipes sp.]|nr:hypothetical protein [Alistipes sp.]MDE7069712.1 hypothetical protein [Alistipes sp.]